MTHESAGSLPRYSGSPHRRLSRRLLAASSGAAVGTAALVRTLLAQSEPEPSAGHNPFVQSGPAVAGPEGLVALLSYVPRAMLDAGEGSGVHWYYADLTQQFDAVGVPRTEQGPDEESEAWLPALMTLATGERRLPVRAQP